MKYLIENLKADHKKSAFSCGHISLDNYIRKQAKQDMKRYLSAVFVMIENNENKEVLGYYTLSNNSIDYAIVPDDIKKKMPPSYTSLPVTLLGRLAVSECNQGKGIGQNLLVDALRRSWQISKSHLGSIAVIVDPIDQSAHSFYAKYGFILLPDGRGRMFLSMATITDLF